MAEAGSLVAPEGYPKVIRHTGHIAHLVALLVVILAPLALLDRGCLLCTGIVVAWAVIWVGITAYWTRRRVHE